MGAASCWVGGICSCLQIHCSEPCRRMMKLYSLIQSLRCIWTIVLAWTVLSATSEVSFLVLCLASASAHGGSGRRVRGGGATRVMVEIQTCRVTPFNLHSSSAFGPWFQPQRRPSRRLASGFPPTMAPSRKAYEPKLFDCQFPGCNRSFKNPNGRSSHFTQKHKSIASSKSVFSSSTALPLTQDNEQHRTPPQEPHLPPPGTPFRYTHSPGSRFDYGDPFGPDDDITPNFGDDHAPNPTPDPSTAGARVETHPHLCGQYIIT